MKKIAIVTSILLAGILFAQCSKDNPGPNSPAPDPVTVFPETDSALFAKTVAAQGFHYYKGSNALLPSTPASAHKAFFRVRFNDIAWAALSDNGKLPIGSTFPKGSLIVKELHGNADGSDLKGYAVMEKLPDDPNAADQWVWAEYLSTTLPAGILVAGKGMECKGCHSTNDRDRVRLFNLVP